MSGPTPNLLIFDRELLDERAFWIERLAPASDVAALRRDGNRPAGPEVDTVVFRIEGDTLAHLRRLTGGGKLLTFTALVAGLKVCLYKHGGGRTTVVGSPARAEHAEPNVLAIRDELDPAASFRALLVQVAQTLKDAYARQRYPHARLIRDLGLSGEDDRFPLFDVVMTFDGLHGGLPSLEPGPDLVVAASQDERSVTGRIAFRPSRHRRETVADFARHLVNVLGSGLADVNRPLAALSVLSEDERRERIGAWNATGAPFSRDRAVHELFEARAAASPDAVAVSFSAGEDASPVELTYAALNAAANRLARRLQRAGVGPEVLVAIGLPRSPELIVAILAVLKASGAYVPLDPAYPSERLAFMLDDCRAGVLLTRADLASGLPASAREVLLLDGERQALASGPGENLPRLAGPDNLAYVIYTSGSTGTPKGVAVAHRGLTNMVEAQIREFGVERDSRVVQLASLSFDASISEIMMALAAGAELALGAERHLLPGPELLGFLATRAITHATIPPSALAVLDLVPLPALGVLIVAGEACPPALIARWSDGRRVFNAYGPTEITVCATAAACHRDRRPHSIGRPIANTEVYVLDADLGPAPLGAPGELHLGGVGVARGYLGRPGLTAERFVPNPFRGEAPAASERLYRTGDLAMYLPDGALEFVGRADQQVKVRGYRIEPGEVEAVLARHPDVRQAVVVARADRPGESRLVAYVTSRAPGRPPDARALREHARLSLPDYMVPASFVGLAALPLTPNGKVDRRALPAPERSAQASEGRHAPPRTATEEIVAGIWARLLGIDAVGIHDDFFALGGHSLLATRLVSQVRETLGADSLAVRHVFELPTVARLSARIDAERRDGPARAAPPLVAAPREDPVPLSFAQQRLWFLAELEGPTSQYNMPIALRLDGPLDRAALDRALDELHRRHETLRTTFPARDGIPRQAIAPASSLAPTLVDLGEVPAAERAEALARATAAEAERPFDLAAGPLVRGTLFRLEPRSHVLLLTLHHIVTDGWSLGILAGELSKLYESFSRRAPSPLPEPALQYADFARWQRSWLTEERLAGELAYWTAKLAGAPALLELPADRPRPAVQTFRGGTLVFSLPAGLTAGIRALSRASETTVFMTLLASLQALILRHTGRDDIVIGTDVANRGRAEIESLVGFFVNQLALRTDLSGDPTFRELLARVRETCLDAYAHQDVPFQRLLDGLRLERDLSRTPLFQVKLVLQNAPFAAPDLAGLTLSEFAVPSDTTTFDLVIALVEAGDRLDGFVTYRTELYDASTIERLLERWRVLLDAVTADPARRLSALPVLTGSERGLVLETWNDTRRPPEDDRPVHRLIEAQAARVPEAVALRDGERQLTYAAMDARAAALAARLRALGVGPEVTVGVLAERSIEMVVGLLAILKAGGAYLPLDPAYPFDRLAYVLEDARPPVLLTQSALEDGLPAVGGHVLLLDDEASWTGPATGPPVDVAAEGLAYVIYTSGSTGRPKAVTVPHRGLSNLIAWHRRVYGIGEGDHATQVAGTSFDASVWEIWPYLAVGASLSLAPPELTLAPADLRDWLVERAATVSFLPTPLAEAVLPLPWPPATALRLLLTGGDKLHASPPAGLPFAVVNNYGPTENTVVATFAPLEPGAAGPPPIGRPVDNARLYIVDAALAPVPIGVAGELLIGGASLARGYLGQPGHTAEKFVPDPFASAGAGRLYRTGDLCRYLPGGDVEFLGRLDSQVSVRGFRVELGEVEAVLARHPDVSQAAVVVWEREAGDPALAAYVVVDDGAGADVAALRAFLRDRLPAYMLPAAFVTLPALPLTPNGKLDRRALPAPDSAPRPEGGGAPRTPVEEALREIWTGVLKREVGVHDNFFELGGDSILSIQIVARAAQRGIRLTARQMFQHQTVAELAAVADTATEIAAEQGAVVGEAPLTPIQRWFFEQEWRARAHYTQSILLETPPGLDAARLAEAFARLIAHHDALRLRFEPTADGWRQTGAAPGGAVPFERVDLAAIRADERPAEVEARAAELQASLDISAGPLARLTYFDHGAAEAGRLLLVVHHLAVDAVSWRILIEDLVAAYEQLARGEAVRLPDKTTAFRDWARRLAAFGERDADAWREPLEFWRSALGAPAEPLPVRPGASAAANTLGSTRIVTVSLTVEETRVLLQETLRATSAQINDVLLTALLVAVHRWSGHTRVLVDLEGHGREDLFDDVSLVRTVGWFTVVHPVALSLAAGAPLGATLAAVRAALASARRFGIHHGLLRHLHPDPAVREELARAPRAEISFNYLGQMDSAFPPAAGFVPARESQGPNQDPREARAHALEVGGLVLGERLAVDWRYSTGLHRHADIERLAHGFVGALRELIGLHAAPAGPRRPAPGDFPLARLDAAALDRLLRGREGVEDVYPLSPMQQGMLFHTLYEPEALPYLEQLEIVLEGELDAAAFARAWQRIVERHAVWRTGLAWAGLAEPLQIVHASARLAWREQDWRSLSPDDRAAARAAFLTADRAQGFALDEPPLMRCALLRVADDRHHFVWTHHHTMMDGWCLPLLLGEALALHEAFRRGEDPALPAAPQYRAFIEWLGRQDRAAAERFWRAELAGFAAPTPIRVAAPGGPKRYPRAERELPAALTGRLRALAREHRVTVNTLVQGAWAVLLSRYGGERDVVFGATTSGRPPSLPGVETTIGLFLNTVPVRVAVPDEARLVPWLQGLLAAQTAREPHAFCSLVDVQGWSEVPRGTPLFESFLVFENYPVGEAGPGAGALRVVGLSAEARAGYPLTLVAGVADELSLGLIYDGSRFAPATIARMLEHLEVVLAWFAADPGARLGDLVLATAEDRRRLRRWNATDIEYPRDATVYGLFAERAARAPDAVALTRDRDDGTSESLTYGDLARRANELAHRLRRAGVGPEVPVAILAERSPELVAGILGILAAGGAFVPLDVGQPLERLAAILDDVRPPLVLTLETLEDRLPATAAQVLLLDDVASWAGRSMPPATATTADNLLYVMYTSGSTGRPRGTAITHRNVVRFALTPNYARFTADDVFGHLAPIGWDALTLELWSSLLNGGRLAIFPPVTPSTVELAGFVERHGVTCLWLTSGLFHQMVEHEPDSLRGLTWLLTGGDVVSPRHVRELLREGGPVTVVNGYGPMENTVFTACHVVTAADPLDVDVPIGRPVGNTRVHILDERLRPAPLGAAGELCGGGDGVGRGYHGDGAATAERFAPDAAGGAGARLYRSGDLARWHDDGTLRFLGRLDWQVKIRGFRVDPTELAATLEARPGVRAAVVVPREDAAGVKQLVAYVVFDDPVEPDPAPRLFELRRALHACLPEHMVPAAFVPVDALPLTAHGKIDRRALPEPAGPGVPGSAGFVPPRDPVELQLLHVWEDVFERRGLGVRDNFFELGGHSILAIALVARIDERLGRALPVAAVMERPTVELQAELLRAGRETPAPSPLVAIQPRGRRRPLFCLHPGGGTVFCYLPLAYHLGADQPVYGIQSVGMLGECAPLTRIEDMAALYVETIRRVQPEGPYRLAGWSLGGMVAFETARQLRAAGAPVALVALIDGYAPATLRLPDVVDELTILRELAREVTEVTNGHVPDGGDDGGEVDMVALARRIHLIASDAGEEHLRRLLTVFKTNLHAAAAYRPGPYAGPVTIFRASEPGPDLGAGDPTLGWQGFVSGPLDLREFPGDHFGPVREPHVGVLAEGLRRCLDQT